MKRTYFLLAFFVLILATFVIASPWYHSSNGVTNPINMITKGSNYANFTYVNNGVCPPGDFNAADGFCKEQDSGVGIASWEIVAGFTGSYDEIIVIADTAHNSYPGLDLEIFYTKDNLNSNPDWHHAGSVHPPSRQYPPAPQTFFVPLQTSTEASAFLIARNDLVIPPPVGGYTHMRVFFSWMI